MQTIGPSAFELLHRIHFASSGNDAAEDFLGRRTDTAGVYAVRIFRKDLLASHDAALAERVRQEQKVLRLLTQQKALFVTRLLWSFQDDSALYLVTVSSSVIEKK